MKTCSTFQLILALGVFAFCSLASQAAVANRVLVLHGWPDYVSLTKPLPDMTNCTIEAWVFYTGGEKSGEILSDNTIDYANDFDFSVTASSVWVRADKSGGTLHDSASPLNIGDQWHHVAWVMTSTNSLIFLDGLAVKSFPAPASEVGFHAANPRIGGWWDNYDWDPSTDPYRYDWIRDWCFVGKLDELRIWNIALSGQQISTNMSRKLTGMEAGLVSYYNFDDGTPNDLTTTGNHGIFAGEATTGVEELPIALNIALYPGLTINGTVGSSYRIEYLDALVATNSWQTLTNLTIPFTPYIFIDSTATANFRRFYRALLLP